jgi:hypothetical protein
MKDKEKKYLSGCTVIPALFTIAIVFTAWALLTQGAGKPAKTEQAIVTATPATMKVEYGMDCRGSVCEVRYRTPHGTETSTLTTHTTRSFTFPTGDIVSIEVESVDDSHEVACGILVGDGLPRDTIRDYQTSAGSVYCSARAK